MPGEHIEGLIERLLDAEVEFVVIGGMAAVLHGARHIRVVNLPTLIELKTIAGRPKYRLALPVLVATLEEKVRRNQR